MLLTAIKPSVQPKTDTQRPPRTARTVASLCYIRHLQLLFMACLFFPFKKIPFPLIAHTNLQEITVQAATISLSTLADWRHQGGNWKFLPLICPAQDSSQCSRSSYKGCGWGGGRCSSSRTAQRSAWIHYLVFAYWWVAAGMAFTLSTPLLFSLQLHFKHFFFHLCC